MSSKSRRSATPSSAVPPTRNRTRAAHVHASIFVAAFDAERIDRANPALSARQRAGIQPRCDAHPGRTSDNRRAYLDPLNFATNFAFFRDADGLHTRLSTANYWAGYGAGAVTCWMTLFAGDGESPRGMVRELRAVDERDHPRQPRNTLPLSTCRNLPGRCSCTSSERPGTTSSNTRSTHLAMLPRATAAAARCHARMMPMHGRQTATPASRRLPPASKFCCGFRTAIQFRFRPRRLALNRMGDDCVTPPTEPIAPFATRAVEVAELMPERQMADAD